MMFSCDSRQFWIIRSRLVAWLTAILLHRDSIPGLQSVIFHVEHHPVYNWFTQCVTFNFYPTPAHELAYNLFNMAALYGVPLLIIIISYTLILWEISKKSRESREQTATEVRENLRRRETFRRSGIGRIEKARIRTLKMTIVIVLVFVACWTPYFVINAWFWFDEESAHKINAKVTRGLLIFAVSNSCVNPIVYGMFTHTFAREFKSWCCSRSRCGRRRLYEASSSSKVRQMLAKRSAKQQNAKNGAPAGKLSQHANDACAPIEDVVASGLHETPYLGNVSNSTCSSSKMAVKRQTTPPHIAQGMGQKDSFEKYFLI
ncbi:hypothetical protein LSH36_479g02006 [Paralvinella palmiformis]|uniref:G-protein coupled receptors family 1 profile domain-containing protein n=1 Tax=Paralvinella palmiformis TaxID=53620 RepID=A0AAD9J9V0_9ANNE|nr:hypothetical protein LSH36_479g02006 [Paralvinella palmiformis]